MKVLFASKNPSKIKHYVGELEKIGIEVLNLNDINVDIEIEENGKNAVENAIKKSEPYYKATNITTIAIDDNLYIEGLKEEEQPGTHVRRVQNKRLTDEEMLNHYINIVKKLGGKAEARWVKGVAICKNGKIITTECKKNKFFLVTKPSETIREGYPLDSISVIPEFNKYLTELSNEEKTIYRSNDNCSKSIIDFIKENI